MKVLLVTTSYPARDDDPSGHFVRAEARSLARAGHDVHVIAPRVAHIERDASAPALFVHGVKGSSLFGWPGAVARVKTNPRQIVHALPFLVDARRRIAELGACDLVIGHWMVPAGFPLLVDHPAKLDVVAHGADVRLLCALPRRARERILEELLDRATRFRFVASASLQTLGEALPIHLERRLRDASYVEPAAIEILDVETRAAAIRAEFGEFVLAVGRFIELKRFHLAIEAAAQTKIPIVLVGDGPLRFELQRIAERTGARATFTGLLSREETLAWMGASRALVHPSRSEAAPTVVREARALGVPVLATNAGDVGMWAKSDAGIELVEATAEAFASALEKRFACVG